MGPVKLALQDARLKPQEINEVGLVGGSTRIPMVQKLVTETFERKKNPQAGPTPTRWCSGRGSASRRADREEVKDILLLDVTPLSLGIETLGGVMTRLIERNTTIPTRKEEFSARLG